MLYCIYHRQHARSYSTRHYSSIYYSPPSFKKLNWNRMTVSEPSAFSIIGLLTISVYCFSVILSPNDIYEGDSSTGLKKNQFASNLSSPLGLSPPPPPPPYPPQSWTYMKCFPCQSLIVTNRLSYLLMPSELPAPTVSVRYVAAALVNPAAKMGTTYPLMVKTWQLSQQQ